MLNDNKNIMEKYLQMEQELNELKNNDAQR